MPALELGERLREEVVVMEGDPTLAPDQRAALLPSGHFGDELIGRGELDVDLERVLQRRNRLEQRVAVGDELQVDVERRGAPALEHRARAAGQVHADVRTAGLPERRQEELEPFRVYGTTHSAARS